MKITIFLGPSLPLSDAKGILLADYRPPAGRGDIIKAVDDGAKIIGLIDGVFYQRIAVSHREILSAIKNGVIVVGGASIGAIRACELDVYGMIGVGEIYRWYKEGKIIGDDEVAVAFHPITFQPISEALVNIRATLNFLIKMKKISEEEYEIIIRIAKEIPFYLRNYNRILQKAIPELGNRRVRELEELIKYNKIDQKRLDSMDVLKKIKSII
ncbi:MAG: TfuA-related McrA-glycine thioamidation protein [Candidatus Methanomethyliaceae archaeon]|nr:TfuA-related McrA-glycine thioamidation protein [Candidatus Methanomethyliaceae archaeon]MDW7970840.1 TfuA-related McrA-glycine thioamidation protein [Nitrososphaerota archaeon]